jgi:LuxR family maltose regulon positive regulatory protein
VLQQLEQAGAFVVSLDARRSWFRYHQMFADLLQLELRRTAPSEVSALHAAAAGWFAEHGFAVEAVRHAQAAQDWELAARLLADHWLGLVMGGQGATAHELLARFPPGVVAADAELTALMAAGELTWGSLQDAERYLARAARGLEGDERPVSVPAQRRGRLQVLLAVVRLWLGRQRGDLPAVVEEAERLLAPAEAADDAELGLGEDLRALALVSLGIAEVHAARMEDADRHLEQCVALARRTGRPYLELTGLAHGAVVASRRSYALGEQRSRQAVELASRHGWGENQVAGVAYAILGGALVGQGRLEEAEPWLERAGQTFRTEADPGTGMGLHYARWSLNMARGRHADALADLQAAEQLAGTLVTPPNSEPSIRARLLQTLVRMGQTQRAEAILAGMDEQERGSGEIRTALASQRLTQHDPQAATAELAPLIEGSIPEVPGVWMLRGLLLEAIARDALGDQPAAGRALERALDLAERGSMLIQFLLDPAPGLLARHARQRTAHTALIADILRLLAGTSLPEAGSSAAPPAAPRSLREPLSQAEIRVLRYLPTALSVPEVADQLCLSVNTVRTHMRHIYEKLDTHRRHETVRRARVLGLLAPFTRSP